MAYPIAAFVGLPIGIAAIGRRQQRGVVWRWLGLDFGNDDEQGQKTERRWNGSASAFSKHYLSQHPR
jgi:hypothetical protein